MGLHENWCKTSGLVIIVTVGQSRVSESHCVPSVYSYSCGRRREGKAHGPRRFEDRPAACAAWWPHSSPTPSPLQPEAVVSPLQPNKVYARAPSMRVTSTPAHATGGRATSATGSWGNTARPTEPTPMCGPLRPSPGSVLSPDGLLLAPTVRGWGGLRRPPDVT